MPARGVVRVGRTHPCGTVSANCKAPEGPSLSIRPRSPSVPAAGTGPTSSRGLARPGPSPEILPGCWHPPPPSVNAALNLWSHASWLHLPTTLVCVCADLSQGFQGYTPATLWFHPPAEALTQTSLVAQQVKDWCCHCSGTGSLLGLETSPGHRLGQKKKKKKKHLLQSPKTMNEEFLSWLSGNEPN